MTVASRNLQVITGRAAREGGRERVCFAMARACVLCQKPGNPTTSCASRPSAGIDRAKCLISLKATGEQETDCSLVASPLAWWRQSDPLDPLGDMLAEQRREKSSI